MKPIEVTCKLPKRTAAITLWPVIAYAPGQRDDPCVREHEIYHWEQALRFGVLPWYVLYACLWFPYGSGVEHPLEGPAYATEGRCRAAS